MANNLLVDWLNKRPNTLNLRNASNVQSAVNNNTAANAKNSTTPALNVGGINLQKAQANVNAGGMNVGAGNVAGMNVQNKPTLNAPAPTTSRIVSNNPAFNNGALVTAQNQPSRFIGFQQQPNVPNTVLETTPNERQGLNWNRLLNGGYNYVPSEVSKAETSNKVEEKRYRTMSEAFYDLQGTLYNNGRVLNEYEMRQKFPEFKDLDMNVLMELQNELLPIVKDGMGVDADQISQIYPELLKGKELKDVDKLKENIQKGNDWYKGWENAIKKVAKGDVEGMSSEGVQSVQDAKAIWQAVQAVKKDGVVGGGSDYEILSALYKNNPEIKRLMDDFNSRELTEKDKTIWGREDANKIGQLFREATDWLRKDDEFMKSDEELESLKGKAKAMEDDYWGQVAGTARVGLRSTADTWEKFIYRMSQDAKLWTIDDIDDYLKQSEENERNVKEYNASVNRETENLAQNTINPDVRNYYNNHSMSRSIVLGDVPGFFLQSTKSAAENIDMPIIIAAGVVAPEVVLPLMATDTYVRESEGAFEELLENGASYDDAEQGAVIVGVASTAVELYLEKLLGGVETTASRTIRDALMKDISEKTTEMVAQRGLTELLKQGAVTQFRSSLEEGLEEIVQQSIENYAVSKYNPDVKITDGLREAFEGGFFNPMNLLAGGGDIMSNVDVNALNQGAYNAGVRTREIVDNAKNSLNKGAYNAGSFLGNMTEDFKNNVIQGGTNNTQISQQQGAVNTTSENQNNINGQNYNQNIKNNKTLNSVQLGMLQNDNRMNPSKITEFKEKFGKDYGQALADMGYTESQETNVPKIEEDTKDIYNKKKEAMNAIEGEFQDRSLRDMLNIMIKKAKNTLDYDMLDKYQALKQKHNSKGLTMAEANDMREEFSYKVKTKWGGDGNSDKIDLANNVYSAVKNFLEKKAEEGGMKDLKQINRDIAMRKYLSTWIGDKAEKQSANNMVSLTDWVILAEAVSNPYAAAGFAAKKIAQKPRVKNAVLNAVVGRRENRAIDQQNRQAANKERMENIESANRGKELQQELSKPTTPALPNGIKLTKVTEIDNRKPKNKVTKKNNNKKSDSSSSDDGGTPTGGTPTNTNPTSNQGGTPTTDDTKNAVTKKQPKKKAEVKKDEATTPKQEENQTKKAEPEKKSDSEHFSYKDYGEFMKKYEAAEKEINDRLDKQMDKERAEKMERFNELTKKEDKTDAEGNEMMKLAGELNNMSNRYDRLKEEEFNKKYPDLVAEKQRQNEMFDRDWKAAMDKKMEEMEKPFNELRDRYLKEVRDKFGVADDVTLDSNFYNSLTPEQKKIADEINKEYAEKYEELRQKMASVKTIEEESKAKITENKKNKVTNPSKVKESGLFNESEVDKGKELEGLNPDALPLSDYREMQRLQIGKYGGLWEALQSEKIKDYMSTQIANEKVGVKPDFDDNEAWDKLPEDFEDDWEAVASDIEEMYDAYEEYSDMKNGGDTFDENTLKNTLESANFYANRQFPGKTAKEVIDQYTPQYEADLKIYNRLFEKYPGLANRKIDLTGAEGKARREFASQENETAQDIDYQELAEAENETAQDIQPMLDELEAELELLDNETPQTTEEEMNKVTKKTQEKPKDLVTNPQFETLPKDVPVAREAKKSGPKRIAPDRVRWQQLTPEEGIKNVTDELYKRADYYRAWKEWNDFMKSPGRWREGGQEKLQQLTRAKNELGVECGHAIYRLGFRSTRSQEFKDLANTIRIYNGYEEAQRSKHLDELGKSLYQSRVRSDLRKGYIYPQEVLDAIPGAKKAVDDRKTYQKGLNTSFSAKDERIDYSAKDKIGGGMKRQDGKQLTEEQKNEIIKGVGDFQRTFAINMKKMAEDMGIVYVHVNGKNVFMSNASGMFRREYNDDGTVKNASISIGGVEKVRFKNPDTGEWETQTANTLMSHELGHVVDYVLERKLITGGDMVDLQYSYKMPKKRGTGYAKYLARQTEVVARAFEQYMAVEKGAGENYFDEVGYWSKDKFENYVKPILEKNLKEKLGDWYIDPESVKFQKNNVLSNGKNKITNNKVDSKIKKQVKADAEQAMKTGLIKGYQFVKSTKDLYNLINGTTTQPRYELAGPDFYREQSEKRIDQIERHLKEEYGTTENPYHAAFIDNSGEWINGNMGGGNWRDVDHREIAQTAFDDTDTWFDTGTDALVALQAQTRLIRVNYNDGYLNIDTVYRPSRTQKESLQRFDPTYENIREVNVDITDPETGRTLNSGTFETIDDAINFIDQHFGYGVSYLKDNQGNVAGAVFSDGTMVLVEDALRPDTAWHETSHRLYSFAKENSPELYNAINKIAKEAPQELKDYVKNTYGDMSPESFIDEVFAWQQGKYSAIKGAQTWYQKMWDAIKRLWNDIRSKFGKQYADLSVFEGWEKMNSEQLMKEVDRLLKGGKEVGNARSSGMRGMVEGDGKAHVDNNGNAVSSQMENYMKKSKARVDEDTNKPLVEVYHTTTGKIIPFTEFNPVGTEGYRFGKDVVNYYTDDKDMSGSYAHQSYKTYEGKANLYTRADVDNFIKEINEGDYHNYVNGEKLNYEIREVGPNDGLGKDAKYGIYQKRDESKLARDKKIYKELTPIQKEVVDGIVKYGGLDYYFEDVYQKGWDKMDFDERMKLREKEQELNRAKEDLYNIIEEKSDWNEFFEQFKADVNKGKWTGFSYKNERELIRKIEEDVKYKINGASNWQYEGYVNITNPYIVDAEGRNWNTVRVDSKYLNETKETWKGLSQADKDRITKTVRFAKEAFDLAKSQDDTYNWFDYSEENQELGMAIGEVFPEEFLTELADLEWMGDSSVQNMVDAILNGMSDSDIAKVIGNSEGSETTNDIVKDVLRQNKNGETNYDGIIIKNVIDYGGKSENKPAPHNIYVTFNSNQFKSRFNEFPTEDADIRYQKNVLGNGKNNVTNGVRFQRGDGIPMTPKQKADYINMIKKGIRQLYAPSVSRDVKFRIISRINYLASEILDKTGETTRKERVNKHKNRFARQEMRLKGPEVIQRDSSTVDKYGHKKKPGPYLVYNGQDGFHLESEIWNEAQNMK